MTTFSGSIGKIRSGTILNCEVNELEKIIEGIKDNWNDMESSLKENNAQELVPLFMDYTNEIIKIVKDRKEELNNEYIAQMSQLKHEGDTECNHIEADGLLCELLEELGFIKIVEAYRKLPKWYL